MLKKTNWTIGASVDVKLHEFKDGTLQHKTYFIEFYDIGGYSAHKSSAKMFYAGVDGKYRLEAIFKLKGNIYMQ